jgi:hypothetical protein
MWASWSHALGGVDQQQHHVGVGDGLQRLDHRELLDRLEHLALAAQAGGVDQFERRPSRSKGTWMASRVVPGWSKATSRSSPSQALISVDLPTFGRPATARRMGRRHRRAGHPRRPREVEVLQRRLEQAADALAVGRRHRMRLADAQLVELGQPRRIGHALGLVDASSTRLLAAQVARDVVVLRRQPARRRRTNITASASATAWRSAWPSLAQRCRRCLSGSKPPVSTTMKSRPSWRASP